MNLLEIDASRWPHWRSDDGNVLLINADCLEVLPTLPKEIAIVSDPPYGIAHKKGTGGRGAHAGRKRASGSHRNIEAIAGDEKDFDPSHLLGFGKVVVWGADHYSRRLPHGRFLAWNKLGDKEPWDSFSDVEFAWNNKRGASRIISYVWKGMCQGAGEDKNSLRDHPTQKPVCVMRWSIDQCGVVAGDVVADPYMGSGTTGVACVRLGRQFIGIELEPRYYEIAIKRIKAEIERFPLFEKVEAKERTLFDEVAE